MDIIKIMGGGLLLTFFLISCSVNLAISSTGRLIRIGVFKTGAPAVIVLANINQVGTKVESEPTTKCSSPRHIMSSLIRMGIFRDEKTSFGLGVG